MNTRAHARKVLKIPGLVRDPDSGLMVINSKRGRKMGKRMQREILAEMRAERLAREVLEPEPEPLPF